MAPKKGSKYSGVTEHVAVKSAVDRAAVDERLDRQLTSWREKLLALDKRQRLLYFKHTPSSSLEFGELTAAEILGLVRQGETPLRPKPEEDEKPVARSITVVNKTAATLKSALNRLNQQSQQSFADRGVWTLQMGLGMLRWTDPSDGNVIDSPLLMVPVQLKKTGADSPFVLFLAESDIAVNPALKLKLEDFSITLPDVDPDSADMASLMAAVAELVDGRDGWDVIDRTVCSTFTFHKEAIYRDLLANAEAVKEHPLVELLAVGPDARSSDSFAFDPLPIESLDKAHPPEKMFSILDADSSQRRCILAAVDGQSFVMDGPPGTGKSQTIANMVAELISHGKTVLFVSEKAAALDVVRDRLDAAGLKHYLLELHSHAATRKHVVQELAATLNTRPVTRQKFSEDEEARLTRTREELSGFAAGMNEVRTQLGMSVFTVIAALEDLPDHVDASADPGSAWATMSRKQFAELREKAVALGALWHVADRQDDLVWRGLKRNDLGAPEARELKRSAARACELAETLATRLETIDVSTGVTFRRDKAGVRRRAQLLQVLSDRRDVPSSWFTRQSLGKVRDRLTSAQSAVENLERLQSQLEDTAGPRWRELDFSALSPLKDGLKNPQLSVSMRLLEMDNLAMQLSDDKERIATMLADGTDLAAMLGVPTAGLTGARLVELTDLAMLASAVERPDTQWFNAGLQRQVADSIAVMDSLVDHVRRRQESLSEQFTPGVLDLDLPTLAVRFRDTYKGFGKFSSAARADKKLLKGVAVSGKVDKALISQLDEAASWQQAMQSLAKGEELHGRRLGAEYQGLDTDFGKMRVALDNAQKAVALAGIGVDATKLTEQLASGGVPDPALLLIAKRLSDAVAQWTTASAMLPQAMNRTSGVRVLEELISEDESVLEIVANVHGPLADASSVVGRALSIEEAVSILDDVVAVQASIDKLDGAGHRDMDLFGGTALGKETDFAALSRDLDWVDSVRDAIGVPISEGVAERIRFVNTPVSDLLGVSDKWDRAVQALLENFTDHRQAELAEDLLGDVNGARELLVDLEESAVPDIENWCKYVAHRGWAHDNGFKSVLKELRKRGRTAATVGQTLEYAALEAWVDEVVRTDGRLKDSHAEARDSSVARFKELDRALISNAHARVISKCSSRAPSSITSRPAQVIIREAQKKTRHKPIRMLLEETGSLAQELKPCFMMSPLAVSQYLPANVKFDVVIFDEASQVLPSDAINCVYRGNQLIVAGDQKQLPPTDFFSVGDDSDEEDDEVDVFQSVLDLAKGAGGLTSLPLNWHYRSRHEDLISYSNYRFYDGKLFTFPSAVFDAPDLGVELFHVNGVYKRGGTRDNPIEAAKVVERVLYFATNHPEQSIGVVTFSAAQADAVTAEMERQAAEYPRLAELLGNFDRLDGFFVKSLENVQGDERDVIVFSLGYGPDENGKFTMNFGPLNRDGGWRRLNVAITRARRRVEVVSSFRAGQMTPGASEGLRHLKNYIDFAERGQAALALDMADSLGDVESPFEEQVIAVIRGWGYEVVPQVGVAGYRIDMAVRHPDRPGSYVIGIECDGAAYHSSRTARDRDRLRESVLRNLGWAIHRIWGLSWWRDRARQELRLRAAIDSAIAASDMPKKVTTVQPAPPVIEIEELDFDSRPEWAVEYTMIGDPEGYRREPKTPEGESDMRAYFVQVINAEAPIHYDLLVERFKQAWGNQRFGSAIKRSVDSALASASINGKSVAPGDDNICRVPGRPAPAVRIPADGQPKRKFAHIPQEELDLAVIYLVRDAHSLDLETLAQQLSRLFGWQKATQEVKGLTQAAVDRLINFGRLTQGEGGDLLVS